MTTKIKQHGTYSSYNSGCKCPLCTEAKREYGRQYRARNAARIKACIEAGEPLPTDFEHGKVSSYTGRGCRCPECTTAQREAHREYRVNNPEKVRASNARYKARLQETPFEEIPHGTIRGYNIYGCRCADCRKANTARCQRYRDANREKVNEYAAKVRARLRETEPPRHGTLHGYVNYSCRCDLCKEAQQEYSRKRRAAQLAEVIPLRQTQQPAIPDDLAA